MLIDWFTIIAQIINFIILVWLLKHFLYKPILNAIDEREALIAEKLSNAETIQKDAKAQSEDLQKRLEELEENKDSLLTKAKEEAEAEGQKLMQAAKMSANEFKEKTQADFELDAKKAVHSMITAAQKEVFSLTRKVLRDLAGVTLESQMVETFVKKLSEIDKEKKNLIDPSKTSQASQAKVSSSFELSSKQQDEVQKAINHYLNYDTHIQFQIVPDLIHGIELIINGHKIAWSIDDYLTSMEGKVHDLLTPKIQTS